VRSLNYSGYLAVDSGVSCCQWGCPSPTLTPIHKTYKILLVLSPTNQPSKQTTNHRMSPALHVSLGASEQVRLEGGVGFSVEGGQDSGEGPGHAVCRLPGLQDLLCLDGGLGHGRVGGPQAGPAGSLQPLEHRGVGGVNIAVVGGRGAGAQAGGAAHIPVGGARQ